MSAEKMDQSAEARQDDWVERVPCPDESCIGTMGADGRCRFCGRQGVKPPAPADSPEGSEIEVDPDTVPDASGVTPNDQEDQDHSDMAEGLGEAEPEETGSEAPEDWEQRELCPDESCIGTLGADGRCRVCGKSAPSG